MYFFGFFKQETFLNLINTNNPRSSQDLVKISLKSMSYVVS